MSSSRGALSGAAKMPRTVTVPHFLTESASLRLLSMQILAHYPFVGNASHRLPLPAQSKITRLYLAEGYKYSTSPVTGSCALSLPSGLMSEQLSLCTRLRPGPVLYQRIKPRQIRSGRDACISQLIYSV